MDQDSAHQIQIALDRAARESLSEQIRARIVAAIEGGTLPAGARLPSWRDLASRLGVSRGTVRTAYEALIDAELIVSNGARGTRVAAESRLKAKVQASPEPPRALGGFPFFAVEPLPFQNGVSSAAGFPVHHWSRALARAARASQPHPAGYPNPGGEAELRDALASYLRIARGIACAPSQLIVTCGYAGGLNFALRLLGSVESAWVEEPGYPISRQMLTLAGVRVTGAAVDAHGFDVAAALRDMPDSQIAIVTPAQQAPLGMPLSLERRRALLSWAVRGRHWIIEDDYLSELQLKGRATPALASSDEHGRVIHIGTFSKTMGPALRLGFVVVPPVLEQAVTRLAGILAPAPPPIIQHAVATFIRDGHYLRHVRRMKTRYARAASLLFALVSASGWSCRLAGLSLLLELPLGTDDIALARAARALRLAPSALSSWFEDASAAPRGLLLSVTNIDETNAADSWNRLLPLLPSPA